MVEGKGFVGHASNNRALLQHTRVQNAAERGIPRNQAQPGFCRCPAGEALLCGPRRRSPGIISGTPLCARRCRAPGCSGSRSWGPATGILTICVGEMCQRVIVAMALAHSPKLRITDEPTAGLDVTLQVLGPMRGLVRAANSSVLLVSPDLGVIAHHRLRLRAPPLRSRPVGDEEPPDVGLDSMFIQHYIMYIRLSL